MKPPLVLSQALLGVEGLVTDFSIILEVSADKLPLVWAMLSLPVLVQVGVVHKSPLAGSPIFFQFGAPEKYESVTLRYECVCLRYDCVVRKYEHASFIFLNLLVHSLSKMFLGIVLPHPKGIVEVLLTDRALLKLLVQVFNRCEPPGLCSTWFCSRFALKNTKALLCGTNVYLWSTNEWLYFTKVSLTSALADIL